MYLMGIDLGTGGVRVVVCDIDGSVAAMATQRLTNGEVADLPSTWHEQRVESWWPAVVNTISAALVLLKEKGISSTAITSLSVTSTSGTILPVDEKAQPLHTALMYNDGRSVLEARDLNEMAAAFVAKMGRGFGASYALSKILWLKRNEPHLFSRARRWVHATDFVIGKLTGDFGVSDSSTALKTGYDPIDLCWPDFIELQAGIPFAKLPRIVSPGECIGSVSGACSKETGLSITTLVCAGMTDSSAALLAAGAAGPGDWNSTIGTTLVVKGIAKELIKDTNGRVYCHRHPMGWWLPGAASNVGGECLEVRFPDRDFAAMDRAASNRGPSTLTVYPLVRRGELFPFIQPEAEGFVLGEAEDEADLYRGYLEGVGLTERMAYDVLRDLGADVGDSIYVAGGGSRSPVWLKVRADILGKRLLKSSMPESAFGAAILAASNTLYTTVAEAGRKMVSIESQIEPDLGMQSHYTEKYDQFVDACRERGYLK